MGWLSQRQRILINSLAPADRLELADYLEYVFEKSDPKKNPGGHLPEGSLADLFNKQNPRVKAALVAMDKIIETPRFEPFMPKVSEAERLQDLGMPIEAGLTLKGASDAIDVGARLQSKMGTDRSLPPKPPTLRDHLSVAALREEPMARGAAYADRELAKAGIESGLPLRDHLELASNVIGASRGYEHDEPIIERGNNDLREDVERSIISVADSMP